jgi:hypothetical protein
MELDHGGLEPPMAKSKSDNLTSSALALKNAESRSSRAIMKEVLQRAKEANQQYAILIKTMLADHEIKAPQDHYNDDDERSLSEIPRRSAAKRRKAQTRPPTCSKTTQKPLVKEQATKKKSTTINPRKSLVDCWVDCQIS